MDNYENGAPEQIARDVKRYADLQWNAFKLEVVEKLSVVFGNAFGVIVFLLLLGMGLLFFTGVLTYLLGLWINSMLWASVIMGGLFIIMAFIVLSLREKVFANFMVGIFSELFFDKNNQRNGTSQQ
jgi:hypothetical protein